eukprot:216163_1
MLTDFSSENMQDDLFSWINDDINTNSNNENPTNPPISTKTIVQSNKSTTINEMIVKQNDAQLTAPICTSTKINNTIPLPNSKQQPSQDTHQIMDLNYLFTQQNDIIAESDDEEEQKKNVNLSLKDDFATNIYKTILKQAGNHTNIIFSPFSIISAMTICLCGAANNTLDQLLSVLYSNTKNKSQASNTSQYNCQYLIAKYTSANHSPLIKVANKLWITKDTHILDSFMKTIGKTRDDISSINASQPVMAASIINKWCSNHTKQKIQNVITPRIITPDTKLLITNAVYMRGKFVRPFEKTSNMISTPFYSNNRRNKKTSKVIMMYSRACRCFALKVNGVYDIVKLRYKQSHMALICVINNHSVRNKIPLTMPQISKAMQHSHAQKLRLYLPKFKYEFTMQLNDVLNEMGITDAFEDGVADFSAINGSKNLKIDNVIHKAIIEVDEEGTEAAAVTVVTMDDFGCAMPINQPPEIKFNHPFVFYIYEEAKEIVLFSGRFVGK